MSTRSRRQRNDTWKVIFAIICINLGGNCFYYPHKMDKGWRKSPEGIVGTRNSHVEYLFFVFFTNFFLTFFRVHITYWHICILLFWLNNKKKCDLFLIHSHETTQNMSLWIRQVFNRFYFLLFTYFNLANKYKEKFVYWNMLHNHNKLKWLFVINGTTKKWHILFEPRNFSNKQN